jgi:hypothetical protein
VVTSEAAPHDSAHLAAAAPPIDWSQQHCGVHQAPAAVVAELMPDLQPLLETFPDDLSKFTFDVKVHMLMPGQYPCIPNWHTDFVPRVNGIRRGAVRIVKHVENERGGLPHPVYGLTELGRRVLKALAILEGGRG